uniref:Uncharacterized protein n=1 Tax=Oryza punctata TaxID=4537 RepID=A0A0E0LIE3_ORYPU
MAEGASALQAQLQAFLSNSINPTTSQAQPLRPNRRGAPAKAHPRTSKTREEEQTLKKKPAWARKFSTQSTTSVHSAYLSLIQSTIRLECVSTEEKDKSTVRPLAPVPTSNAVAHLLPT